jgi:carbamoyl-phosphate synthase large subunit
MKNLLITAIGGDISQSSALLVRKYFPDFTIIGCDSKPQKIGKDMVDFFYTLPDARSDEYIKQLNHLIKSLSIDIVIPMNENELDEISNNINSLEGHKFIISGPKVIEIGTDKYLTNKQLIKLKIQVPWTLLTEKSLPKNSPCIAKSRKGSGSKNVKIINNKMEAEEFYKKKGFIFQELLKPSNKEITCAVFRDRFSNIKVLLLLRKLKNGFTTWAKVIQDDEILRICKIIAEELNLIGSMNVQLINTSEGPRIFEINPRFSSTVLMRDMINFQDLKWSIDNHLGKSINFSKAIGKATLIKKSISEIEVFVV